MKTIIEVRTGNTVDTGDTIQVNGQLVRLTDFNIPEYIGKGILTFAQPTTTPAKAKEPTAAVEAEPEYKEIPFYDDLQFQNPKLKAIFLNWGVNKGLVTESQIMEVVASLWYYHPSSVLSIALKEISLMLAVFEEVPEIVYTVSMTDGQIKSVKSQNIKYDDYIAVFETIEQAKYACSICKEILDELF